MNAQLTGFSCWLIRRAARAAPEALGERLEEEWLADLAARHDRVSRLRLAIGCWWATGVLAHEHGATGVLAAGPSAGGKSVTAYLQDDLPSFSRRTGVVFVIVCFHAVVLTVLATAFVNPKIDPLPPPTKIVDVVPEPSPPRPPPPEIGPPVMDTASVDPGPLLPPIPAPEPQAPTGDGAISQPPPGTAVSAAAHMVTRIIGGPERDFPDTGNFYPPSAIRLGEHGVVSVRVCVDSQGRLTAEPALAQSSGSARLDDGALRLARAGSGRYRATTEDGRPVSSCYPVRIRFDLKNR